MIKWFDEETADKEVASLNLSTQDVFSYFFVNNKETENKRNSLAFCSAAAVVSVTRCWNKK